MIKHVLVWGFLVFAVSASTVSTTAFAGDSKPVQMTDEQMDQVTAAGVPGVVGRGFVTAIDASGNAAALNGLIHAVPVGGFGQKGNIPGRFPQTGRCTAGLQLCNIP
jgi:hypothetical protein